MYWLDSSTCIDCCRIATFACTITNQISKNARNATRRRPMAVVKIFQVNKLCNHFFLKLSIQHMMHHNLSIYVKMNQDNNQDCKMIHKKKGQLAVVKSFQLDSLCKSLFLKYCNLHKCHHKLNIDLNFNQDNNQDCKKLHKKKGQMAASSCTTCASIFS